MKPAATANACRLLGEASNEHVAAPQLGSFFGCEAINRSLLTELAEALLFLVHASRGRCLGRQQLDAEGFVAIA